MSDYFHPAARPIARKEHRCHGCYAMIPKGEQYSNQVGVFDGRWFVNKFHFECEAALIEAGDGNSYEFTPGELDPPQRLIKDSDMSIVKLRVCVFLGVATICLFLSWTAGFNFNSRWLDAFFTVFGTLCVSSWAALFPTQR